MKIYDDFGHLITDNTYTEAMYIGEADDRRQARELLKWYYGIDYEYYRFIIRDFLDKYFEYGRCHVIYFGKYIDVYVDDDEYLVITDSGYEYTTDSEVLCICDTKDEAIEKAKYYDGLVKEIANAWYKCTKESSREYFDKYKENKEVVANLISDCVHYELASLIEDDWRRGWR